LFEDRPEAFLALARRVVESLHEAAIDLAGAADGVPAEDLARYREGDRAIFTRRFLALGTRVPPAQFGGRIGGSITLQTCVDRYIRGFEDLCGKARPSEDDGILSATLLNSDVGTVYAYLCRATGRKPVGPLERALGR
jgi:hypothetical protein